MGRNVLIELGESTYQELEQVVQQEGTGVEGAVIEAIEAYLEHRIGYLNDSFFQIGKAGSSGLGDLAGAHDRYLYGTEAHG